jgi:hypothetical protein
MAAPSRSAIRWRCRAWRGRGNAGRWCCRRPSADPVGRRRGRALRWRFFERHFQYLNAFDNCRTGPAPMTISPSRRGRRTLLARFSGRAPSPAGSRQAVSGYTDAPHDRVAGIAICRRSPRAGGARVALALHAAVRQDILSAQPERLYRAWMAEFRTPFFRSFLVNQPDLVDEVLKARPMDFPKSDRVGEGLRPLLGARCS